MEEPTPEIVTMQVPCITLTVPLPRAHADGPPRGAYADILPPLISLIVALLDTGMASYTIATRLHGLDPDAS